MLHGGEDFLWSSSLQNRKLSLPVICYSLRGTGVTKALAVNVLVCASVCARSMDVVQAKAICYESQLAFSEPLLIILPCRSHRSGS